MMYPMSLQRSCLGIVAAALAGQALCAPHLEPCKRLAYDYERRVEQLMRDAWPGKIDSLAIMYVPLTERGIGITKDKEGYSLIRLEFDVSLWYGSWKDVEGSEKETPLKTVDGRARRTQVLDFSKPQVRVAKLSIPISDRLGKALLGTFERSASSAKLAATSEVVVVDGYTFEILLAGRPCVELSNPPRDSEAGRIADFVRFLDVKVQSWRPWEREAFEAEISRRLPY